MIIIGEVVAGANTSFQLAYVPNLANGITVSGSGTQLTLNTDYTVSVTGLITMLSPNTYAAGQVLATYLTGSTTVTTQSGNDILTPLALTTLQRVKDILFDPNSTITLTGATLTQGSKSVTGITVQTGQVITVGQAISGAGIPNGTVISSIQSATQIYLSQNAASSLTNQTLTVVNQPATYDSLLIRLINYATNYINNECGRFSFVQQTYVNDTYSITNGRQIYLALRNTPVFPAADGIHLTDFSWRAGTPSNPSWTEFIPDQYEMINPRTDPVSGLIWYPAGIVRVYGVMPRIYSNMIRASYTGGYPVNWSNPEDHNTHWLPGDITNVCENMVVRRFQRRLFAGKTSEAVAGATITWSKDLDAEDKAVLGQYKDMNF